MSTKLVGVVFALVLAFVSMGTPAVQADHLKSGAYARTTTSLRMRSGPGTSYAIRRNMPSGARVYIRYRVSSNSVWYAITYDGTRGYAHGAYLTQSSSGGSTSSYSGRGSAVANTAWAYHNRGVQYSWGATGPYYFDCSGFTQAMFRYNGISIPRSTGTQAYGGYAVSRSNLRPGDLLVFQNTYKYGISHVGIYVGGGNFVHMSNPSTDTNVNSIWEPFYQAKWWGARRYT